MRRNIKLIVFVSIIWMFVMVYYFQSSTEKCVVYFFFFFFNFLPLPANARALIIQQYLSSVTSMPVA
ncbi:hypothetical protein AWZ03_000375 [Drosophila navojoa]|uniref:Uncharacterized protein n=1 Tax=Drosophila navojoa TaxID=7232 RepID=A0A484C1K0_DRONA|nr:hypothetical protein AWZ03_000375 [Drosophila navojoa]